MDFHSLTRKELQTLCKKNKIPANITNIAMADALSDLQYVEGLDDLMMNQEKAAPQTPSIPHTVSRTKDPETAEPLTRSRRTTTRRAVLDQGSKKDVAETPAPAASSTTSRTRGRKAQVDSSVPVRTRQSVRLLEKNMAELSLKDSKARAAAPVIKMDSLDQTVEEYHQVSDKALQKNDSIDNGDDDDKKKAHKDEIVTENAFGEAKCVGDKVSDEISDKMMDVVDEEADQMDQIIASQQSADPNQLANKSIGADAPSDLDADDDNDSDSQKPVAIQQDILDVDDEADSNQDASKESAVDKDAEDDDSDSQKSVATKEQQHNADSNQFAAESVVDTSVDDVSDSQNSIANQQGNPIAEAVSNQFATGPIVDKDAEDDSNSQNFVANQQENPIAKAVSDQFATESTVDTDTDNDLDSQNSVANQQGNLIAEADSKQFATEPIVDAEADDDSDSQKPFGNQQNIHIAEAYSNLFATESIAAETETDADSSASDTDADDDSGSQKSISDQLDIQTTAAECIEDELFDVGLMEAYEDETPNSNSVEQQISHSSSPPLPPGNSMKKSRDIHVMFSSKEFAMASSPAAIAKQSNCCDSSGPSPNQSEASNQKLAALIQADNKENIDSSGMVLIMKDEESNKKDNVKKKRNNINIAEDDSKPKSLNDKSLRQLTKMLKEKLQISNNKKNNEEKNNTTKKQVPRPALQTLPENLMPAGGPKNEN
ncbi:hypothetical protein KPL70_008848 [Citrus sinensis]|uniref:uncharacterized protein LOC102607249 n=1 Tax=Citrus sinensis TaxID=2711 RepID=UPI0021993DCB|nr:uncharacterized protein LOC102607249 [Citrus sinensis]KAH9727908.1 hypothetical protein KPL70_008848 [Citrus sinensis]KAH9727909.1 hypothetical protein KPL70_008848 [Citrus sinensis]